jgi:hypothetical protein
MALWLAMALWLEQPSQSLLRPTAGPRVTEKHDPLGEPRREPDPTASRPP